MAQFSFSSGKVDSSRARAVGCRWSETPRSARNAITRPMLGGMVPERHGRRAGATRRRGRKKHVLGPKRSPELPMVSGTARGQQVALVTHWIPGSDACRMRLDSGLATGHDGAVQGDHHHAHRHRQRVSTGVTRTPRRVSQARLAGAWPPSVQPQSSSPQGRLSRARFQAPAVPGSCLTLTTVDSDASTMEASGQRVKVTG